MSTSPSKAQVDYMLFAHPNGTISHVQVLSGAKYLTFQGITLSFIDTFVDNSEGFSIQVFASHRDSRGYNVPFEAPVDFHVVVKSSRFGSDSTSIIIELPRKIFSTGMPSIVFPPLPHTLWKDNQPAFVTVEVHLSTPKKEMGTSELMMKAIDGIETELATDLPQVFPEGDIVVLKTADGELKAQKQVLMARSEYFRNMFTSGMKEEVDGRVEIPDARKAVMVLMLIFMYGGGAVRGHLRKADLATLFETLEAADKYRLDTLKNLVALVLAESADASNGLFVFQFLSKYGMNDLAAMVAKNP